MADHNQPSLEAVPSQIRMTQIRDMLSKAARMRRTDSAGDLMPNVGCLHYFNLYLLHGTPELYSEENITLRS